MAWACCRRAWAWAISWGRFPRLQLFQVRLGFGELSDRFGNILGTIPGNQTLEVGFLLCQLSLHLGQLSPQVGIVHDGNELPLTHPISFFDEQLIDDPRGFGAEVDSALGIHRTVGRNRDGQSLALDGLRQPLGLRGTTIGSEKVYPRSTRSEQQHG